MRRVHRFPVWSLLLVFVLHAQDGTGPLIDQKLAELRNNPVTPPLPEVPTDESPAPAEWLALISWNIQVGGTSASPEAERPPLVAGALQRLFSGTYDLLAAQEISSSTNSEVLVSLLPGEASSWEPSFFDTTDRQDNGFWFRPSVTVSDARPLFVTSATDASGRLITDPSRAVHPPQAAHFIVGDFDFLLITVHLTFAGGDTAESAREFRVLLDYLDEYFKTPGHDPDVIICGDFNIPSRLSGQTGSGGITLDQILDADPRFQTGERRFVVTVHEPTSRTTSINGGLPNNNFDHFVFSADVMEELIQARRVSPEILTADPEDPEERLTSDHFPTVAFFRTSGPNVQRDSEQDQQLTITSVVNGASFEPGIAAGSWVTVFGENLAPATRTWREDEIIDGVLPAALDGVQVSINGKPASVFFISPGQLNVQAPDDTALGQVSVEVVQEGGNNATASAELQEASPAFFLFSPEDRRFLAAVHPDGVFVGKQGLFEGALATRPAEPGEIILLFGTGFGPTEPPVPAGRVFNGAAPLANPVNIRFGGIEADVPFAGLSGAGLNQFNVVVPEELPSGDIEVAADVLGFSTPAGAFITVESSIPPPPPPPAVTLTAEPDSIERGETATLRWTSENATNAELSPGIGPVAVNGSLEVSPASTTTYTITARGAGGEASASVRVTVREPPPPPELGPIVVISQIYGGGGNQGARLTNDFIELLNRGDAAAQISGWTVQYASASGSSWSATTLSGIIEPGQYYLIQEGMGRSGGTVPLPAPDAVGGIGLSATSGKVALVRSSTLLTGSAPMSTEIVDLVGYGSANFAEGNPAAEIDNTTALFRRGGGCVDSNNNSADFTSASPAPRNRSAPRVSCN